ncbi:DUF6893 family small protein [Sinosporangium siamense]
MVKNVLLGAFLVLVAVMVIRSIPDLKRYMKIRSM